MQKPSEPIAVSEACPEMEARATERVDLEARAEEYLADAKRRTAQAAYDHYCPSEYRAYNRQHSALAANGAAADRVLAWRYGRKGLLLSGPTGRVKTRTAWELVRLLCASGVEVRPYHAMDWFSELHECVKYGRDEAKEWVSAVAWRSVVFIDDWGQEANLKAREDWAQAWFFRFLDLRIERGLPLIVTTNLSAQAIIDRHESIKSDPLLRRLLEVCEVVKFA